MEFDVWCDMSDGDLVFQDREEVCLFNNGDVAKVGPQKFEVRMPEGDVIGSGRERDLRAGSLELGSEQFEFDDGYLEQVRSGTPPKDF